MTFVDVVSHIGEETAEHLLLSWPRWKVEYRCQFAECIEITDVFSRLHKLDTVVVIFSVHVHVDFFA